MRKNKRTRLFISLVMALIFGGSTYIAVLAQPSEQPTFETGDNCYRCHQSLYASWHTSAHGQALDDPIFLEKWHEQDDSDDCLPCHTTGFDPGSGTWAADGVSCSNCHDPVPVDHPASPAPINQSSALCETCHSETVYEWKSSEHRLSGLNCVDCHSQHTATLKAADTGLLCVTCHHDIPTTYSHTIHIDQNLSCPDCHLESLTGVAVEERGYAATDHNFSPKITTCDNCHEYRLQGVENDPSENVSLGVDYHDMLADFEVQGINIEPNPVNPISFTIISAITGMVAGLLLAPWIQERYKKIDFVIQTSDDSEEE